MDEIWLILFFLFAGLLWFDGMRARERAIQAARAACRRHDLQLLDETVALEKLRPRRSRDGRVRLLRRYRFEFLGPDDERLSGWIELMAGRVTAMQLEQAEGLLHDLH